MVFITFMVFSIIIRAPYTKDQKSEKIVDDRKTPLEKVLLWFVGVGMMIVPFLYVFTLVTDEVYKLVRHPMYSSIWLWAIAQALLLHNWVAGFSGIVSFGTMYFLRISREEKMMLDHFGEKYANFMKKRGRVIPKFFALCFFLCGCSSISGTLPAATDLPASGQFQAGAAKVDITPMPGIPMGGYAIVGTFGRGYWTRLYARALYFEDSRGESMAMVSCDLWAIPAGLADRISELVAMDEASKHLAREQLVLAATHTHHSPGNFSSCEMYNQFASPRHGFDPQLFEFLAQRITKAIVEAVKNRRPAEVYENSTELAGVTRNRSFEAFILNPERDQVLRENSALAIEKPLPMADDVYRAIDPKLTTLRIVATNSQQPIAVAAFFATHPTAMGSTTEVYNSDMFGVATTLVERQLAKDGNTPIVAIFNGPEGDICPNWKVQDRQNTVRLGKKLAQGIAETSAMPGTAIHGEIHHHFEVVPLAGRIFTDENGVERRTADDALPGVALLGGATDGRSVLHDVVWREGAKGLRSVEQGPKLPPINPLGMELGPIIGWILRSAMGEIKAPREMPIGVYRLGSVHVATLPGEFTTTMGRRIAAAVSSRLDTDKRVLLIGLANEFISYFTTPEEYEAQRYEAASMLYGPHSGTLVKQELQRLAGEMRDGVESRKESLYYSYKSGKERSFSLYGIGAEPTRPDGGLGNLVQDLDTGYPVRDYPHFIWEDTLPEWGDSPDKARVTPSVSIEYKADGGWQPLEIDGIVEDDNGLHFVTIALSADGERTKWSAIWMVPKECQKRGEFRFCVQTLAGEKIHSEAFTN